MKLAINLATRGRALLVMQTIGRTLENIRHPETVFMVSADADDEATCQALRALIDHGPLGDRLKLSIEPREDTVGAKWNRVLAAVPDADVYMPMCDDGPAITPAFDEKILEAASYWPDRIGVVFNHLENLSFTGVQAITGRFARLMGYIYPEHFPYWFVDHWLSDVAEMIDRVAFADVRLDCSSNRPPTMEMREPAFWATFYDACHLRRRDQARYIMSQCDATPEWEKSVLRARYPLIEQYSKMINDGVRAMHVTPNPPDDRYRRLKAAAQKLLKEEILPELERAV
jgi:hypothetical protein